MEGGRCIRIDGGPFEVVFFVCVGVARTWLMFCPGYLHIQHFVDGLLSLFLFLRSWVLYDCLRERLCVGIVFGCDTAVIGAAATIGIVLYLRVGKRKVC